jgi:N-acyl-D-aspartate/D-glutamate deacylase
MNEDNVAQFIQQPFAMIGSDSGYSQGKPHPRLYGAFPRVIRRFVRELKVMTLEEAIHKMTGMTAQRLKLQDTGLIKKGFRADAVLFDPKTFSDTATYRNPCRFPEGLRTVMVNGVVVIEGSDHTGAAPGILHRGLA